MGSTWRMRFTVQGQRWGPSNWLGKDFGARSTGGTLGEGVYHSSFWGKQQDPKGRATRSKRQSHKIQKAKPEEQRLEAIKRLRRSKQGKRWGQARVDEAGQQTGERGRKELPEEAAHAGVYSSLSPEGNIMSLCLPCQKISKGKSPPSLNTGSYRGQSTAATS